MIRHPGTLRKVCVGLTALAVLGALPEVARAASIGFRNDLPGTILVQGESIVNGTPRRGQVLRIFSGKMAWDTNLKAGARTIRIYDARNNRLLLQQMLPFDGKDVSFRVVLVPATARTPARVQLVPLQPPPQ
jgi:hypothetical protein